MKYRVMTLPLAALLWALTSGSVHASIQNDAFTVCKAEINEQFKGEEIRIKRKRLVTRGSLVKLKYRVTNATERFSVNCNVKDGKLTAPLAFRSTSRGAANIASKSSKLDAAGGR